MTQIWKNTKDIDNNITEYWMEGFAEKVEFWTDIQVWVDLNSKKWKRKYSKKETEDTRRLRIWKRYNDICESENEKELLRK